MYLIYVTKGQLEKTLLREGRLLMWGADFANLFYGGGGRASLDFTKV